MLEYLAPYRFYPEVVIFCGIAAVAYARGLIVRRRNGMEVPVGPAIAFFAGVVLTYAVMHTILDYYAQFMFWSHRAQHLVLHHMAPFLMALGWPHRVLPYALPPAARATAGRVLRHPLVRTPYRVVQQPVVACVLFVGIIYFWMVPEIHFAAMLSESRYRLMNASVFLEGLLFWWLIVDPRGRSEGGLAFWARLLMLWAVMIPQIVLGAYVALSNQELYEVYSICGRAWPIDPMTDQRLGGLITWIPAAMMSVIGALVVFRMWLHEPERESGSGSLAVQG